MRFQSQVYTKARGSIGGITYTANQYQSLIARARTSPVNPMSQRQTGIRTAFSDASAAWQVMSTADRALWDDYAASVSFSGPMGNYYISGRAMFMRNYSTATYIKGRFAADVAAVIPDPPGVQGPMDLSNPNIQVLAAPGTGFGLSVTSFEAEDWVLFGQISRAFPDTRNSFKGPFQTESMQVVVGAGPASVVIEWEGLVEDSVYFVSARAFTDGVSIRMSVPIILRAVASVVVV